MSNRYMILVALLCTVTIPALAEERPNIILFIVDDVSSDDFGCTGNCFARTPSIDQLAADGTRFTNFFLTASSCSPSRCSIITGRYPHNNGEACELHQPLSAHLVKFPALLKKAGYYTAIAGKDHMPQKEADEKAVWDLKKGGRVQGNSGGEAHWLEIVRNRPREQPFFFWFASFDAHRGWDADQEWDGGKYGPAHQPEKVAISPYLADTRETRKDLASYYNEITRFDWFVGQVVQELKRQQTLENTLILVMADNGSPFPRAKTRVHDSGMKAPFIAHWPAGIRTGGSSSDQLLSAIDICPTVLELAGVTVPQQVQGTSLAPLLADPEKRVREYAFSEHNWHDYEAHGRAVRDSAGYLYIRNALPEKSWAGPADSIASPSHKALVAAREAGTLTKGQADVLLAPRPSEELYLTVEDPAQLENLVEVKAHARKLAELRRVMDQWQDVTGDSVPENISRDFFDRDLGYIDKNTNKRISGKRELGDPPGMDRGADQINKPGPR